MKALILNNFFVFFIISINAQVINYNSIQKNNIGSIKINGVDIIANAGMTLPQLLNQQLGIIVNGAYQPKGTLVNTYMEGALGGKVLILLNNIPIYDPSEIASSFDLNFISINEIESIDIYKGSLSSLYGSGAIAGVININTKKLNKDSVNNHKIYCAIGNQKTINSGLQIWKSENKYSYSFKFNSFRSTGFSYANDTSGSKGFDNDAYNSKEISGNIDYRISKSISLSSSLRYSKYKADSDIENFIDSKDYSYRKGKRLSQKGSLFYLSTCV